MACCGRSNKPKEQTKICPKCKSQITTVNKYDTSKTPPKHIKYMQCTNKACRWKSQ